MLDIILKSLKHLIGSNECMDHFYTKNLLLVVKSPISPLFFLLSLLNESITSLFKYERLTLYSNNIPGKILVFPVNLLCPKDVSVCQVS